MDSLTANLSHVEKDRFPSLHLHNNRSIWFRTLYEVAKQFYPSISNIHSEPYFSRLAFHYISYEYRLDASEFIYLHFFGKYDDLGKFVFILGQTLPHYGLTT